MIPDELATQFIFSDKGREFHAIINDNQGQMSANKLMREVFLAGYYSALSKAFEGIEK